MGLILHCGSKAVSLTDVHRVPTPDPTDTHFPIPHGRLIGEFTEQLNALGLRYEESAHALNNGGETYFGMFRVRNSGGLLSPEGTIREWDTVIGLRNDHGKRFAAGAVGGETVFVCDNLSFFGEYKFQRKHTRFILRDLPRMVADAIAKIWYARTQRAEQIRRWQETCVTDTFADHLILEMFRRKVFPARALETVVQEYRSPCHEEHLGEHGDRTLWTLHNAVTQALKGTSLRELPGRTLRMQPVLDSAANVVYN